MKKDIISRRQFFRNAAKSALPLLVGMAVLPVFVSCEKENLGCAGDCTSTCSSTCTGACTQSCIGTSVGQGCNNGCSSGCINECRVNCSNNCGNGASNSSSNDALSEATDIISGHEYVDLGLSVKWARCNVDASQPQQDGYYTFNAFREYLSEQERINLLVSLGYYNQNGLREFGGISDVDVITHQWGNKWRTPSETEWNELKNNCDYEAITYEGVEGVRFTSRINRRSIFIPLSGRRYNEVNYHLQYTGSNVALQTSTFWVLYKNPNPIQRSASLGRTQMGFFDNNMYDEYEEKTYLRGVTTGGDNPTGCNNSCVNSASSSSCSSCQYGCNTSCDIVCASVCQNGCSNSCTTVCNSSCSYTCEGRCVEGCLTTCYGGCDNGCRLVNIGVI